MSIVKFYKNKKFSHGLRSISFLRRSCPFSHFATICMQKLYEALKRNGAQIRPHTCMQICTHPLLSFKYQIDMEFFYQTIIFFVHINANAIYLHLVFTIWIQLHVIARNFVEPLLSVVTCVMALDGISLKAIRETVRKCFIF